VQFTLILISQWNPRYSPAHNLRNYGTVEGRGLWLGGGWDGLGGWSGISRFGGHGGFGDMASYRGLGGLYGRYARLTGLNGYYGGLTGLHGY
jgi:hypothetical protein